MRDASVQHRFLLLVVAVAGMIVSWIMITPPGGGPDEPSHLVRAGAIAHGQLSGTPVPGPAKETFTLSDAYVSGDVACFAFQPTVSASCLVTPITTGAEFELTSRSQSYPIWGHLPGGLASRVGGDHAIWPARMGGAMAPILLLAATLALLGPKRPLAAGSVLLAATPMAWFTFGIVNPSAMAIAGGIALWTALVPLRTPVGAGWLAACGWAALALPRRDGLIWACLALAIALAATDRTAIMWWRGLSIGPRVLVGASTLATLGWGFTRDSNVSRMVVLAPLIVVGPELIRIVLRRAADADRSLRTVATAVGLAILALAGTGVLLRSRPGGWDPDLAERVVSETGNNLIEAIGVLGWLDTSLPLLAIVAWVVAFGMLVGAAMFDTAWPMRTAAIVIGTAIVTSWLFELFQGNTSGTYWQGRYSIPLLVGAPIVLGAASLSPRNDRLVGRLAGVTGLVVVNVALLAAARRFGVGTAGSLLPWEWNTYNAPVPPIWSAILHASCSAAVAAVVLWGPAGASAHEPGR